MFLAVALVGRLRRGLPLDGQDAAGDREGELGDQSHTSTVPPRLRISEGPRLPINLNRGSMDTTQTVPGTRTRACPDPGLALPPFLLRDQLQGLEPGEKLVVGPQAVVLRGLLEHNNLPEDFSFLGYCEGRKGKTSVGGANQARAAQRLSLIHI